MDSRNTTEAKQVRLDQAARILQIGRMTMEEYEAYCTYVREAEDSAELAEIKEFWTWWLDQTIV